MARVRRTSLADFDLADIWVYIAQHEINAADWMLGRLEASHQMLARYPQLGEQYQIRKQIVRRFVVGNYVTFDKPDGEGITVLRVLHGARKMDELI